MKKDFLMVILLNPSKFVPSFWPWIGVSPTLTLSTSLKLLGGAVLSTTSWPKFSP